MDSDLHHHHPHHHHPLQQQQHNMNSSLTRYRSAPSSYFADLINTGSYVGEDCDETDPIFARFMSGGDAEETTSQNLCEIGRNALPNEVVHPQFVGPMKHETEILHNQQQQQQQPQMIYQGQSGLDHKPAGPTTIMDNSYNIGSSMALDRLPQMKMGGGNNSNLIRHSSSPAGLFSHINVESGYGVMRGIGNFGAGSGTNAEASFSSGSRLKGQMDFSSGPSSSSGLLTRISEIGGKSMGMSRPEDGSFDEGHRKDGGYITGFPSNSWDDSAIMSENFLKGLGDDDRKTFSNLNSAENQNGEGGNHTPTVLSHHLSLPTSSAELSAMEKLLQFQDSVPLKIRAKRGCATHPRSIAERVRRTRISERMRKLQELVPNMDKQTNTADMLDLAVDYIKDLQKQVKTLSDNRAKCTCSNEQKP